MDEVELLNTYSNGELIGKDPRPYLDIGSVYHNDTISTVFGGSKQVGIKRPKGTDLVYIFSTDPSHEDIFLKDLGILLYHGAGKVVVDGMPKDQSIDDPNGNSFLRDAQHKGTLVFLFQTSDSGQPEYKGPMIVFMEPYFDDPSPGCGRKIVFPLIAESLWKDMDWMEKETFIDRVKANVGINTVPEDPKLPKQSMKKAPVYNRSEAIREQALAYAKGICQLCDREGPFKVDGVPFLEVHHIKPLSEGGSDTIDNVVGLCPNCHRKVHMVPDVDDQEKMRSRAEAFLRRR